MRTIRARTATGVAALFVGISPAMAQDGWGHGWMIWDADRGWGGIFGGGLGMILFWGLIILLVVFAVRWFSSSGSAGGRIEKTPLQILQERYARGEIDKEELEDRRKTLSGG